MISPENVSKTLYRMTQSLVSTSTPRLDPSHIQRGDEVYLNHSGARNELRRLALLALSSYQGTSGPFTVESVTDNQALLTADGNQSPFAVDVAFVTRERPLSETSRNPFTALQMPLFPLAIKL